MVNQFRDAYAWMGNVRQHIRRLHLLLLTIAGVLFFVAWATTTPWMNEHVFRQIEQMLSGLSAASGLLSIASEKSQKAKARISVSTALAIFLFCIAKAVVSV